MRATHRSSLISLGKSASVVAVVCAVMAKLGIPVEMMSQGASKVNISIVVPGERAKEAVQELHSSCFFEGKGCVKPEEFCS